METMTQLCETYKIGKEVVQLFVYSCLKDVQIENIEEREFNEEEIKILSSCICLHSLGFELNTIKKYVLLEEAKEDTRKERTEILQKQRNHELEVLHQTKKKSDCIERILMELQNENS